MFQFDHDRDLTDYYMEIKNGGHRLTKVTAGYDWYLKSDFRPVFASPGVFATSERGYQLYELVQSHGLTVAQRNEIDAWCREIDGIEAQEKQIVTDGVGDIKYKKYAAMDWFAVGKGEALIVKEGCSIFFQKFRDKSFADDLPF